MNTSEKRLGFCVIGCGRLGISLAVFLAKGPFVPKAYSSKSRSAAQRALDLVGIGKVYEDPVDAVKSAELVFITTPDSLIEQICRKISAKGGFCESHVVYHMSGALSSDILVSAKSCGASTGSIHPLQAFTSYEKGHKSQFKGANISLEGDNTAIELGQKIIKSLQGNEIIIPTHLKTAYHAAAVVASNYLVTLEHFALELLKQAGLSEENGFRLIEPLILGTLDNIKTMGTVKALTGPIARGDVAIVSRHLEDIDKKLPHFLDLYKILGKCTLDIALDGKGISDDSRQNLEALFSP